ncbi:DNA-binding transcriptional LysR family regulator [Camelimonas lactis]|uniref:DNA-binding transcriptional LysR family regulator n=2 Tax=Camelimonas lactis TaxID=659006 RepID=A0A4R2GRA0_9HYPH|nr:DNA-binding transcriptional LysR family regulator [Camelimonas lactis]
MRRGFHISVFPMNEPNLQNVATFLRVIEAGGFAAAARELGVTQSTVSRRVAELERKLGRRLLERTTRRVLLTEAGERYADAVRLLVAGLADAEADFNDDGARLHGPLRITMPSGFGRLRVLPALAAFAARYPLVRLDVDLSDRYVDLLSEGYDLAVRLAEPETSGLDVQFLKKISVHICAAPAWLRANPVRSYADLENGRCLVQKTYAPKNVWRMQAGGVMRQITIRPLMTLSDTEAVRVMALAGLGVARLPDYQVDDDLRNGRLQLVSPDLVSPDASAWLVWPRHKGALPRVQALREHLAAELGEGASSP